MPIASGSEHRTTVSSVRRDYESVKLGARRLSTASANSARNEGSGALRPRARIMRTLGDELISSEVVAVVELVKNAYDADATRVLVRFREPLEPGTGGIDVIDDGHGMSLETVRHAWLEP